MLFAITAKFRPLVDTGPADLQAEFNAHLAQPCLRIPLAGYVRDREQRRVGYMVLLEAPGFADAEAYIRESPYAAHDLYESIEVIEFDVDVGRLG
jgi:uncharacterized protein YciI